MERQLVTPLRKKRLQSEESYTRPSNIEAKLVELEGLSRSELLDRIQIRRRDDPNYVPSECLLYFVRASRADNSMASFESMYKVLTERVMRSLPKADSVAGETTSLTKSVIRDKVFGRFVELLSADRVEYCEKLDYFEVRFDGALASLRRDAQEQAWRDEIVQLLSNSTKTQESRPTRLKMPLGTSIHFLPQKWTDRLTGRALMQRLRLYHKNK